MNECMYAHVTSSTMKSLTHCGTRREKGRKMGVGQNEPLQASMFYAFSKVSAEHKSGQFSIALHKNSNSFLVTCGANLK